MRQVSPFDSRAGKNALPSAPRLTTRGKKLTWWERQAGKAGGRLRTEQGGGGSKEQVGGDRRPRGARGEQRWAVGQSRTSDEAERKGQKTTERVSACVRARAESIGVCALRTGPT